MKKIDTVFNKTINYQLIHVNPINSYHSYQLISANWDFIIYEGNGYIKKRRIFEWIDFIIIVIN